jgi:uncharacterized protein (UPF0333 family)
VHRLRDQSGQALVEFAIILPVVLLILLGIVDFGLAFNSQNDEANMANLAVRLADVNLCAQCNAADGNAQVVKYIAQQADTKQLATNGMTICFYIPKTAADPNPPDNPSSWPRGNPIAVKISSNFKWLHYVGLPLGTTEIVANVTGRLEQDYNGGSSDTYVLSEKYDTSTHTFSNDPGCA